MPMQLHNKAVARKKCLGGGGGEDLPIVFLWIFCKVHRWEPSPSEADSPPLGGFVPLSPWKFRMSPFRGEP